MTIATLALSTALTLPLGMGAPTASQGTVALADATVYGTIKSVDMANNSFVITAEGRDVTIKVTSSTKYMLDGKESTMAKALASGNTATVTHLDKTASKVDATTARKPN